jgi:hypothetical protein
LINQTKTFSTSIPVARRSRNRSLGRHVNGKLAQDADTATDLLFGFADIVSDISRLTTLEPGDIILTGTPADSTVVQPGDLVEVEVAALLDGARHATGRLRSPIAEAGYPLAGPGALPKADDAQRAVAYGAATPPRPSWDDATLDIPVYYRAVHPAVLGRRPRSSPPSPSTACRTWTRRGRSTSGCTR